MRTRTVGILLGWWTIALSTPQLHSQSPEAAARANGTLSTEAPAVAAPPARDEFVPDEILVGFKPGVGADKRDAARNAIGAKKVKEFGPINAQHWKLPPGLTVAKAIEALAANPNVRYAEPNYIVRTNFTVPDDALRGDLWGLHNVGQNGGIKDADIDALEAWQVPSGGAEVVVAVIDTGIDYTHPDLADKILRDADGQVVGWDFVNDDSDPMDDNRHGTHVAGTIAAKADAEGVIGVAGLNPNVKLVPVKFLSASGSGSTDDAISSVLYAASLKDASNNPLVRITNNSWGGGDRSQALEDAIRDSGALFVAAAGNGATSTLHYPAAYALPNVLSVAATDNRDLLATFSNYGPSWVHLAAPGANIVSTTPKDSFSRLSGTSMATPHVAGAAALALSISPELTTGNLKANLLAACDALPGLADKVANGGRLNLASLLGATEPLPDDSVKPAVVTGLNAPAEYVTETSVVLDWPEYADSAYVYDLRYYAVAPINDLNWDAATPVYGEVAPPGGGSVMVRNLSPGVRYHFAIRAIDLAGNISEFSSDPPLSAKTPPVGWKAEIVDTAGDVGSYRSMVIDPTGKQFIAYANQTNNRVKLATRSAGGNWSIETFGTGFGGISLQLVPAGLPGAGAPSISWADGKLSFATKASGGWAITTIERSNVQVDVTSLAYAPDGTPAISYRSLSSSGGLKFAWRSGTTWKTQVVVAGAVARYSSLTFLPNGNPIIAYSDDANADNTLDTLKTIEGYKTATGYSWYAPAVVQTGVNGYGVFCSIAAGSDGRPLVIHGNSSVMPLWRRDLNGNWSWSSDTEAGTGSTLLVTPQGGGLPDRVYIAYTQNGKVRMASGVLPDGDLINNPDQSVKWTYSLAENDTFVSGKVPIGISPLSGYPSVSYSVAGDLRFTTQTPGYVGPSFLFQDDMESTTTTWRTEGDKLDPTAKTRPPGPNDPNDGNLWHRTTLRGMDGGHTPVKSWYYAIEKLDAAGKPLPTNYSTGTRNWGRLISPPIALFQTSEEPGGSLVPGSRAELKVSNLCLAEGGSRYENGEIQVRVEGTTTWTTLLTRASRTATAFSTNTIDLSAYVGKTIEIGFFFDTKDSGFNDFEGWYVDDVSVKWWP